MNVSAILEIKGRDVVTSVPGCTVAEAAGILAGKRIGAIVITGLDGAIAGIVSERDIVRVLAAKGAAGLNDPVSQHMTRDVITCTEGAHVSEVMTLMTKGRFRHLPVEKNGRLAGLISIGDVVKHRLAEIDSEREALEQYIATA